jgi:hypothetical protein
MPVIATGCNNPTGSDSDAGGSGSASDLAGTAWLAEDEQDRDSDGDPDDRVIAFGSQGDFAGIWYDEQSTDAADPFTDTPMDATSTDNLTGDRGTYTVKGGNEVEVTITEVYETEWQSAPQTTWTRSFSISGDTITFDDGSQLTRFPLP